MKIKGKVKLHWIEGSLRKESLYLSVKFKLPNQILNRNVEKILADTWWVGFKDGYNNKEEFWKDCFVKLTDRDYLEGVAKDLIIDYIKNKYKTTENDLSKKKMLKLIKDLNDNFEVEVEYKK